MSDLLFSNVFPAWVSELTFLASFQKCFDIQWLNVFLFIFFNSVLCMNNSVLSG